MISKFKFSAINSVLILVCCTLLSAQVQKFHGDFLNQGFKHNPRLIPSTASIATRVINRSIDGTNNNILPNKETWGATDIVLYRDMPSNYDIADLKNAMNGSTRPSPREISNALCDEPETIFNARNLSAYVYIWGQFIDHDITLTPTGNTEYKPIALPLNEPLFTIAIPFHRSEVHQGTGIVNPREQSNLSTSWIDGSVVYGSDDVRSKWLRTFQRGKLKTSVGNLLPYNTITAEFSSAIDTLAPSMANDGGHKVKTFVAGDLRANEHPGILSLHTIFVREHNRICDRLYAEGMRIDEEIYQKARKEVGAIIQLITYQEFLPALGITLRSYSGYNPNARPDITNIFASAAYRIGHTMVADEIAMRSNNCDLVGPGNLELLDAFFQPALVKDYGVDVFLKGMATHKQYETDVKVNSILRNFLFGDPSSPVKFGLDLAAINIQRGRDHGLADYNSIRRFFTATPAANFNQITSDPKLATSLASLYKKVDNIDAWIGLLIEDKIPGKSVGKTTHAILKTQFEKLRDGDYYYYANDPALAQFVRTQLNRNKLADVVSRNTSLRSLQANVFFINPCPGENGESFGNTLQSRSVDADSNTDASIYPNPVYDMLTISVPKSNYSTQVEIINMDGRIVKSISIPADNDRAVMNTNGLQSNLYNVVIKSKEYMKTLRFTKVD